ncbi:VOC family protein [Novosphingobium sp. PP1Y]|uniref:VOC family protein n=1 Tax=Novosphingobium sp. PP1Y TaxID=702113 RepID=UPI0002F4614A|nr:VOC family protein [Novosphingobium sp. PP1Y]
MFTHIMVGSNDPAKAKQFYDATLGALGIGEGMTFGDRVYYQSPTGAFGVGKPADGNAACHANGGTIGFAAATKEAVDAFHAAGLAHGGSDEGAPGRRAQAPGNAYGAYLRDPCGNKICAFTQLPEGE